MFVSSKLFKMVESIAPQKTEAEKLAEQAEQKIYEQFQKNLSTLKTEPTKTADEEFCLETFRLGVSLAEKRHWYRENETHFKWISHTLLGKKSFVKKALEIEPLLFPKISQQLQQDKEIFMKTAFYEGELPFQVLSSYQSNSPLFKEKEVFFSSVSGRGSFHRDSRMYFQSFGGAFEYAHETLKGDGEFVLEAYKKCYQAWQNFSANPQPKSLKSIIFLLDYVSPKLFKNHKFLHQILDIDIKSLISVPNSIKGDPQILLSYYWGLPFEKQQLFAKKYKENVVSQKEMEKELDRHIFFHNHIDTSIDTYRVWREPLDYTKSKDVRIAYEYKLRIEKKLNGVDPAQEYYNCMVRDVYQLDKVTIPEAAHQQILSSLAMVRIWNNQRLSFEKAFDCWVLFK